MFCARGVDFFFVLSGFIITYVHWLDLGRSRRVSLYLVKRFVRVYPILWCVALPLLCLSPLVSPDRMPAQWSERIQLVLGSLALVPTRIPPVPGVSWTLRHEILFYAVFLIVIWRPRVGAAVLALWFGACVWHGAGSSSSNFLSDFLFSPYNVEFMLGVCCGAFVRCRRVRHPLVVSIVGLFCLIAASTYYQPVANSKQWIINATSVLQVAQFGVGSALVILGLSQLDISFKISPPKWMMLIGSASYSIYLIHFPVISLSCKILAAIRSLAPMPPHLAFFIVASLGVLAGICFHVYAEIPLLRVIRRAVMPKGRENTQAS